MKNVLLTIAKDAIHDVSDEGEPTITDTIKNIISAVIGILGIVCVVIIIIGGIGYMTSSGDSSKVKKAKDPILYGIIGIIICVLAFAITQFVINAINAA